MIRRGKILLLVAFAVAGVSPACADPAPGATRPGPSSPGASSPGGSSPGSTPQPVVSPTDALCGDIAAAAARYGLPRDYLAKLIWRESRFQRDAVSPAGAQGVAQFMPRTAAGRGLADPFAPREAVLESAAYLGELRAQFGNLGLAAAAYNAGPGRLANWIAKRGTLPVETIDYVAAITGRDVTDWLGPKAAALPEDKDFSCARFAARARRTPGPAAVPAGQGKAWSIILVGNPARDKVMFEYQMVKNRFFGILGGAQPSVVHRRISGLSAARYIVQIEKDSRADANALCGRLLRAGGNCFVLANRG